MTEWKEYKLGEIAEIVGGGTPDTSNKEYWGGNIPWLTPKDLTGYNKIFISSGERFITEEGLDNSSTKLLPQGAVLLSSRAPIGYVAIASNPICTNQGFKSIICNKDIVDNLYMYYWIKNNTELLQSLGTGTTFAEISGSVVKSIDISLPLLPEQICIASILSSLDDKIDLLHRENKTLEAMAETLFRQWFIEEAKEDWEEGKLGDIISVKGGTTPSTREPHFWNGDIAWTSPRDVTTLNGLYLFETEKKITQKGLEQISSGLLPAGTLLMSSRAPVGVLAFSEIPIAINQGYIAILDDKGYEKEFIYLWLKANMDTIHSYSNGSTFMEISKSAFKSLDISIPSKGEVECFVSEIKPYFDKIRINEKQIQTLIQQRDSLLPKLMSGEVKI
ncbi:MAG: restriction endonuclease subunit S [Lentimicrobiaceae bacterium]|nr:restriction endonuclease subunit S [Lentimicrobiaceae bacterium]